MRRGSPPPPGMEERRRSCPLRIRLSKSTLDGRLPRPGPRGGSLPQGLRGPSPPPLPPQGPWEPPSLFNAITLLEIGTSDLDDCLYTNAILELRVRSEEQTSELQSLMRISYA